MHNTLKVKLIACGISFCALLNFYPSPVTLNGSLDLSAMFSCIADTAAYSHNPIELTKGLKDNVLNFLHNDSGKQNNIENDKNTAGESKSGEFMIAPSFYSQTRTIKQFNNPVYERLCAQDRRPENNIPIDFANNNSGVLAFYFMLLYRIAIIFRKKRDSSNINFFKKTV
ncbi:MAG: hypothetical protein LBR69_02335 [Endomicrobium sp.]|jgi:hypothetical protein|nr:hypothetical protein [Endomicrobium sp.]